MNTLGALSGVMPDSGVRNDIGVPLSGLFLYEGGLKVGSLLRDNTIVACN